MNVGYVGLGNMGGALAARLQRQLSHPLAVYDLDTAAVRRMTEQGATSCGSLKELGSRCEIVLLCLPTSDHVRTVLFGSDGLAPSLRSGSLIIDQTTGDPIATRAMAMELEKQGLGLVDAPVSGGKQGAEAGTIAVMVGASEEHLARARPVLNAISPNVFHAGGVGAGQVMKLVNNMVSAAQRLLTLEGMALAVKNGIDPMKASQILLSGGARNAFMEKFLGPVLQGKLKTGFSLALMHKDVRLACKLGGDSGVPLLYGSLTQEFYQLCISLMGRDAEVNSSAVVIDRLSGTKLVPVGSAG